MITEIFSFAFEKTNKTIRMIFIQTKEYFIAKDIATILEYKDTDQAIRQHCKKAISYPVKQTDQVRHLKLVPESDVWRLIIKSTMPEAEKIEKWIMEEVLPSIRKTGSYSISQQTPETAHQTQNETFDLSFYSQEIEKMAKLVEFLNSKNTKTLYYLDNLSKSLNIKSPLELLKIDLSNYYFIPTELGNFINASPVEANKILESKGFQIRENGVWHLTEKGRSFGIEVQNGSYFQLKWKIKSII